jgi:tetratricopeptide (TPR) repeat protein
MVESSITTKDGQSEVISVCLRSARQYGAKGLHDQAVNVLKAALNLEPDNTEVLITLAAAYFELEKYDDALPLLQRAHELDPTEPNAVAGLGDVFIWTGRWDEAIEQIGTLYPLHQGKALNLFRNVFSGFNNLLFDRLMEVSSKYSNEE